MKFAQQTYLDENGGTVDALTIRYVSTYERKGDGFFTWQCAGCQQEHFDRGFELPQGSVYRCGICDESNLLLSSACDYIREALAFWEANKPRMKTGRFNDLASPQVQ